ncbi:uncharacterized protein IL334_004235 [Kwoniella shivajii]|uniref:Pal1 cell morphology protein n=1 Tax=Kwoniella shivajii TaxID=564305 RepID=A0ABZ1CZS7_9TREE|nr:hypothetical protein IL334_004235 [Kwoniella shivajii]
MAPPPPLPPPKDYSSTSTSFLSPHSHSHSSSASARSSINSKYVDQDLAEAVRNSVQIKTPRPVSTSAQSGRGLGSRSSNSNLHTNSILLDTGITSTTNGSTISSSKQPPLPSLNPLIPRRTPSPNIIPQQNSQSQNMNTFQPTHHYSQSSPDMSSVSQQPSLPSTRMKEMVPQNPFEDDEIEPTGNGRIKPPGSGHVPNRSFGGTSLESDGTIQPNRTKFNRSQTGTIAATSSSSHLLGPTSPSSGSTKTRTRRSMSSDSYGFNQEMPVIKELTAGQRKALEDKKGSRHADVIDTWDPTGLGTAMWHHAGPYDAAAPSRNTNLPVSKAPMQAFRAPPVQSPPPKGPTTISLSSPPVPPAKDVPVEQSDKPAHRRGQSGNRIGAPAASRRVSGGGLTGQYSTSMPSSGGYFPNMGGVPQDEASFARMERQRERDAKRQAIKAAWGIDTPEPYEDFGGSPNDGTVDLADDFYSPESISAPLPGKPARSPGLRFGLGPASPPIRDEGSTSPTGEFPPVANRSAGPGGVKRTKSLMQKIKTMRENPNNARSSSPKAYSPTPEPGLAASPSSESPPDLMNDKSRRPGFFARTSGGGKNSPAKKPTNLSTSSSNSNSLTNVPTVSLTNTQNDDIFEQQEDYQEMVVPSSAGSGFVLVESPSSKARAMKALKKEQESHHEHHHNHVISSVPANRTKYLPKPPVAPVMPDFNDIMPPQRKNSPLEVPEDTGLKRKTSMVKKLKDRMAK